MRPTPDSFYLTIGNRTSLSDPDGKISRYSFDALNRLTTVHNATGISNYGYDRSSLLSTVSYPNGAVADYRYDDARRVTQVSNRLNGAVASRYDYTYDRNGNRLSQQETNGGAVETTTYVYDNNDRLTRADYSDATLDYGYDAAYNRTGETAVEKAGGTTVSSKTFSYNNRNQVTSISDSANAANDTTYSYDANGNQTVKTRNGHTLTFVYDVRNRLVRVSQDTTTLGQFRYDHAGMRIQKEGAQGIVRYTYDDGSVLLQTDDTGATLAKYDYGPDRLLSLEQVTEGEQFYHFDALGSVVNLSRPDGSLQARYQYDAWGNERASTGSSWNRFAFTGHEKDEETGLYYFKARFYDPQVGRFLSQDGYLGETNTPPSLHRYLYAYANPTVYVDLYGYEATPWYHQYVNEETDVWETKGETYDTGSDIKDAYLATVDTVNNVLKTAGNEVMAITALPESSWAAAKGWAQDRNVSLREATGDFDSTIGAIPIVSAIRPSNIPRMLRQVFGKPARQAARLAEEGRGGLKAAGEVSDLPPVPELRKANSSITIEGSKIETAQLPVSTQANASHSEGLTIRAQLKEGLNDKEFNRKVNRLEKAIDDGRVSSNIPHNVTDAERRALTRQYRKDLTKRINSIYKGNPASRENALRRLRDSDIDHIVDLQLGGQNVRSNLKTLDSRVNQELGRQFSTQLPRGIQQPITNIDIERLLQQ